MITLRKSTEEKTQRSGVNIIIPERLYQRAQIYTWSREVKEQHFSTWGVRAVVNFWPKVDPDLANIGLDWYWQISCPRSEEMLTPRVIHAAGAVAEYLQIDNTRALILCEAGKTRSVFFCILVMQKLTGCSYTEAHYKVATLLPGLKLKGFMVDWLNKKGK